MEDLLNNQRRFRGFNPPNAFGKDLGATTTSYIDAAKSTIDEITSSSGADTASIDAVKSSDHATKASSNVPSLTSYSVRTPEIKSFDACFDALPMVARLSWEAGPLCSLANSSVVFPIGKTQHWEFIADEIPSIDSNTQVQRFATRSPSTAHILESSEEEKQVPRISCTTCGATFSPTYDLKRHLNAIHHRAKQFWCRTETCKRSKTHPGINKPFWRKDKRNEHERKVHKYNRSDPDEVESFSTISQPKDWTDKQGAVDDDLLSAPLRFAESVFDRIDPQSQRHTEGFCATSDGVPKAELFEL